MARTVPRGQARRLAHWRRHAHTVIAQTLRTSLAIRARIAPLLRLPYLQCRKLNVRSRLWLTWLLYFSSLTQHLPYQIYQQSSKHLELKCYFLVRIGVSNFEMRVYRRCWKHAVCYEAGAQYLPAKHDEEHWKTPRAL